MIPLDVAAWLPPVCAALALLILLHHDPEGPRPA